MALERVFVCALPFAIKDVCLCMCVGVCLWACVWVSLQWRTCINIPLNWHLHDEDDYDGADEAAWLLPPEIIQDLIHLHQCNKHLWKSKRKCKHKHSRVWNNLWLRRPSECKWEKQSSSAQKSTNNKNFQKYDYQLPAAINRRTPNYLIIDLSVWFMCNENFNSIRSDINHQYHWPEYIYLYWIVLGAKSII